MFVILAPLALGQLRAPINILDAGYLPTGYMGDGEFGTHRVRMETMSCVRSNRPETCYQITYQPGNFGWAAVAWQYPPNNWGEKPGKSIEGATKVSFWARGERGGERLQFKAGGNTNPALKFHASFQAEGEVLRLSRDWKRYEISLKQGNRAPPDLSNIVSAFTWVATVDGNPGGLSFYLTGIRYE